MPKFVTPDNDELLEALYTLEAEPGRGAPLMAAAWVDDGLRACLEAYLAKDTKLAAELLRPDQPLGSFGVRIKIAFLLGLIDDEMRSDADVIRSVRNDFAHFRKKLSWNHQSVVDRCKRLHTINVFDAFSHGRTRSPRHRFLISAFFLASFFLSIKEFTQVPSRPRPGYLGYIRYVGKRLGMDRLRKTLSMNESTRKPGRESFQR